MDKVAGWAKVADSWQAFHGHTGSTVDGKVWNRITNNINNYLYMISASFSIKQYNFFKSMEFDYHTYQGIGFNMY